MKIKIFEYKVYKDDMQSKVNKWLKDKDIDIKQISSSESKNSNGYLHQTLYILYEEDIKLNS